MGVPLIAGQIASAAAPARNVQASVGSLQSDASRFSSLLSAGNPGASVVTAPEGNAGARGVTEVQAFVPGNLGDAVLHKLGEIGNGYRATMMEASQSFSGPASKMGLSDMLRIQMSMANASLSVELISNSVSKSAQHIDTLTKMQ